MRELLRLGKLVEREWFRLGERSLVVGLKLFYQNQLQAKEQDIAKYSSIENEKKRIYAAMVDSMDQAIGRILKAVDDKGIAENTFVLFFSDNGGISYGDNRPWRGGLCVGLSFLLLLEMPHDILNDPHYAIGRKEDEGHEDHPEKYHPILCYG